MSASEVKSDTGLVSQSLLFSVPVRSELADFVSMIREIANCSPEILDAIEKDQINHALAKKQIRMEDQQYLASITPDLPGLDVEQITNSSVTENTKAEPTLNQGRPRMPALLVMIFLFIRGWAGGPKSSNFRTLVVESQTLNQLYSELGVSTPGLSTINDNLNILTEETCNMMLKTQLAIAKNEELDDFEQNRIDSTAIEANSAYPTESSLIKSFLQRAIFGFFTLAELGFYDFTERVPFREATAILKEVSTHSQVICMVSGKMGAKEIRKENYKKIYTRIPRIEKRIHPLVVRATEMLTDESMPPSKRNRLESIINQIDLDIDNAQHIADYSKQRVIDEKTIEIGEKILSVSDSDATIIKKGDRDMVFGYRPQLAFSGKGFVTAAHIPEGNAADSGQLLTMLEQSEENTGVFSGIVTVDDGYINKGVRDHYIERGRTLGKEVIFSIGGSKGKRSLGEDVFHSEAYKKARADRSAAEANISTLKHSYEYKGASRRGIKEVRQEQMSKVLAYNTRKIISLRNQKAKGDQISQSTGHISESG